MIGLSMIVVGIWGMAACAWPLLRDPLTRIDHMSDDTSPSEQMFHRIQQLERELAAITRQLEYDRTKVAESVTAIKTSIRRREWLAESRGSYEYDDERYQQEFGAAIKEIETSLEPLARIAANWDKCPRDSESVAKARIDLEQQLGAEREWRQKAEESFEAWRHYREQHTPGREISLNESFAAGYARSEAVLKAADRLADAVHSYGIAMGFDAGNCEFCLEAYRALRGGK